MSLGKLQELVMEGRPGVLWFMGLQRVGHDWATELNWNIVPKQQRIDAFELWCWRRLLRVPWTARIQSVHPKGDQYWVFIGRTDAEAETPILWPPHENNWLIGKDSDAGRDWGQDEKGTTEDEMAGWHHQLNGREFGWTPGVGNGQGALACWNSWGCKELDTNERLNWLTELKASEEKMVRLLLPEEKQQIKR